MSSTQTAREVVLQIVAAGVRDVVVCPGSRSAPLTYAIADAEAVGLLRAHVRVDERTAGFYALGLIKASTLTGRTRPVAVVTTSGTAVANLHPAVLEASHTGLPLVVLSADRPHEWRHTGASQTTLQPGLFGEAVRWSSDAPARINPAALRGHLTRALASALGTFTRDPGPVQVNLGFAEPLVPEESWVLPPIPAPIQLAPSPAADALPLPAGRRTLLVAGDDAGPLAAQVATAAGWPLLAEPSSGARLPGAIAHYQALVAHGLAEEAERIVVFGHPTLSRTISSLLGRSDVELIVVSPTARWNDVMGRAAAVVAAVAPAAPTELDHAWLARWRDADARFEGTPPVIQQAALAVWATSDVVVLGSSNTVRAFDAVVPGAERGARVVANRGLAGIDGLVSTAHGLASGLAQKVIVVLGDLSFAHDVGGLARGVAEPDVNLDVVVLNDCGGGIFSGLEHGRAPRALFSRFFATAQTMDVAALAHGFGASHQRVEVDQLAQVLAHGGGRRVIEVSLPPV